MAKTRMLNDQFNWSIKYFCVNNTTDQFKFLTQNCCPVFLQDEQEGEAAFINTGLYQLHSHS